MHSLDSSIQSFEGISFRRFKFIFYIISEQIILPILILFKRPSYVVCGNHTVPVLTFGVSRVVIIHDVLFEDYSRLKDFYNAKKASLLYRKLLVRYAIRKKNSIIVTVSKTSKKRIVKLYKINPNKIHIITNVFDNYNYSEKFETPFRRFALVVTGPAEHKNAIFLLEAYLKYQLHNELPLIVVGNFSESTISYFSSKSNLKILFFSDIEDYRLDFFYRKCSMLIMPSLDEGFGIPLVQAMKYKKKILCSDIPIFRELVGEKGFLFNPRSKVSFANSFNQCQTYSHATEYPDITTYDSKTQKNQIRELLVKLRNEKTNNW